MPASGLESRNSGTFKDVISRINWLKTNVSDYRLIAVADDDPGCADAALECGADLNAALVEYSYFPRIVRRLKERFPEARVAVRCINLEPLQHLDNHGWFPKRGPIWVLYGMARLACLDWQSKRFADQLLCISDWEIAAYWRNLPGKADVVWLPYVSPDHILPRMSIPYADRRIIACTPTSNKNRMSLDLVLRFLSLAEHLKGLGSEYEFVLTGALDEWGLPVSAAVSYPGVVDNFSEFLGRCRAVCALSPLGYGFKTTVADALAAGAHALVHPALIARGPAVYRNCLIPVDTEVTATIDSLSLKLAEAPQAGPALRELGAIFDTVMPSILAVPPSQWKTVADGDQK